MEQTYQGGCQCGAVAFTAVLDLDRTITCNCSRCQRLGAVLAFTPRDRFTLEKGADALTEYRFNRNQIVHQFCRTCGIQGFAFANGPDGTPMAAVNVNALEGVEPRSLTPHPVDGRSF
ncbi:GFA family protein [Niveispirillum sp. KHB5.9]|uniref:GFA family protein n=1 Tax=Niveispirillum sp. KHB5.9 TaxID=3400269 RepID=UPI003A8A1FE1